MSFTAPHPAFSTTTSAGGQHRAPRALAAAAAAALIAAGGYAAANLAGSGPAAPPSRAQPLDNQVLATSSLPGLTAVRPPVVVRSARAWAGLRAPAVAPQSAARLRALGFTGAVVGRLHSPALGGAQWTSVAERYRTPAAARAEARDQWAQLRGAPGATGTRFAVSGVPGAQGLSIAGPRTMQVAAVFAAGRFAYVVSARVPRTANHAAARSQVSAAGGWLYLALNGCVAPVHHGRAGSPPVPVSGRSA